MVYMVREPDGSSPRTKTRQVIIVHE